MTKVLAKSLHTVTVLVRVARFVMLEGKADTNADAVVKAAAILGLRDMHDDYELLSAALKQLNKQGD